MRQKESGWIWPNIADGFGLYSRLIGGEGLEGCGRKRMDDTSIFILKAQHCCYIEELSFHIQDV